MCDTIVIYGATTRHADPEHGSAESHAAALIKRNQKNVKPMEKLARESVTTCECAAGGVIVRYENELVPRTKVDRAMDLVTPAATVLIENPAAIVDRNVDKHQLRDLADAFVAFLHSEE